VGSATQLRERISGDRRERTRRKRGRGNRLNGAALRLHAHGPGDSLYERLRVNTWSGRPPPQGACVEPRDNIHTHQPVSLGQAEGSRRCASESGNGRQETRSPPLREPAISWMVNNGRSQAPLGCSPERKPASCKATQNRKADALWGRKLDRRPQGSGSPVSPFQRTTPSAPIHLRPWSTRVPGSGLAGAHIPARSAPGSSSDPRDPLDPLTVFPRQERDWQAEGQVVGRNGVRSAPGATRGLAEALKGHDPGVDSGFVGSPVVLPHAIRSTWQPQAQPFSTLSSCPGRPGSESQTTAFGRSQPALQSAVIRARGPPFALMEIRTAMNKNTSRCWLPFLLQSEAEQGPERLPHRAAMDEHILAHVPGGGGSRAFILVLHARPGAERVLPLAMARRQVRKGKLAGPGTSLCGANQWRC